jgi:hypothetical protein
MFRACVAAVAFACLAVPASAATFLSFNGSTGVFGNDLVDSPSFDDTIDLGALSPGDYLVSATISSTYQDGEEADQNVDFLSVMFNGVAFDIGTTGQNEFRFINSIASGNTNLFQISGTSGSNSSYSGTINVAAIPEPSTWAMAMIGFFVIGSAMRRRPLSNAALPQAV